MSPLCPGQTRLPFKISNQTFVALDIDECKMNTDNCHEDAFCTNKIGSFNCTCNPGYQGNGTSCTDIDECTLDTHNCHDDATCKNTKGSFNCTCNNGFEGNGTHCSDIDECKLGTDNCQDDATCINTHGGYNCTCNPGFGGDGFNCTGNCMINQFVYSLIGSHKHAF